MLWSVRYLRHRIPRLGDKKSTPGKWEHDSQHTLLPGLIGRDELVKAVELFPTERKGEKPNLELDLFWK